MLWLMALVGIALAVGFGGRPAETEHVVMLDEASPLVLLATLIAGACLTAYLIRLKR